MNIITLPNLKYISDEEVTLSSVINRFTIQIQEMLKLI